MKNIRNSNDDDDEFEDIIIETDDGDILSFTEFDIDDLFEELNTFKSNSSDNSDYNDEIANFANYRVPREVSLSFERVASHYLQQYKNGIISADAYYNKLDVLCGKMGRMAEGDGLLSEFE